jgi:subtilisin family serine protease
MTRVKGSVIRVAVAITAVLAVLTAGYGQQFGEDKFRRAEHAIPDQFIVVLTDEAAGPRGPASAAPELAKELSALYGGTVLNVYTHALNGFSVQMPEAFALQLSDDPRVAYVETDAVGSAATTQTGPPWGLDRIDQHDRPLNNTYVYDNTGAGVHAYVIDSGIRPTHVDFGGRASIAADFVGDGQNGIDCVGHGTHVAGTLGGATYGVAKSVTIHALRVLRCNSTGDTSWAIAAVDWVSGHRLLPAVANMSLEYDASDALDTAVRNSIATGVTYAVAAGNDDEPAGSTSPQRVSEAVIVAATDINDVRGGCATTCFSNYGPLVDVFAPGVAVLSAYYTSDTATATLEGTSMAAPHVAGLAAVYLQSFPGTLPNAVQATILGHATQGRVTNPGAGSPNRLLFSRFNEAIFIGQSVPTSMIAGQSYAASVQMYNFGTATWTTAQYKLGSQNPQDNFTWGFARVSLPTMTAAGQQVTFNFTVTAPSTPGTYNFQWRMLQEAVEWFGPLTQNVAVSVSGSGGCPPGANTLCPGEVLLPDQDATSADGRFRLHYAASDGNLVLYDANSVAQWASCTAGTSAGRAEMQASDGNFVIYDGSGSAIWWTGTAGNPGAYLIVQNDGNVVIRSSSGAPLWDRFSHPCL